MNAQLRSCMGQKGKCKENSDWQWIDILAPCGHSVIVQRRLQDTNLQADLAPGHSHKYCNRKTERFYCLPKCPVQTVLHCSEMGWFLAKWAFQLKKSDRCTLNAFCRVSGKGSQELGGDGRMDRKWQILSNARWPCQPPTWPCHHCPPRQDRGHNELENVMDRDRTKITYQLPP